MLRSLLTTSLVLLCAVSIRGADRPSNNSRLIIHEWGTFTTLQDETGRPLTGLNTDDERVPDFVHRLNDIIIPPKPVAPVYYKGIPALHPNVKMRLETPVVYFYPPAGQTAPLNLDFKVSFNGGWLSEFYPNAVAEVPNSNGHRFPPITPQTIGSLTWNNLRIGGKGPLPETNAAVWLAPRAVDSALVTAENGETERYLFYRGVANLLAPLKVVRSKDGKTLSVHSQLVKHEEQLDNLPVPALWLVEVRRDGKVAYRSLGNTKLSISDRALLTTAADFAETEFSTKAFESLYSEIRTALIADGLFDDEADAMLNTWNHAYFQTPGTRLFFVLPQQWTNAVLPIQSSQPAEISRTMIGRIELVTPTHRKLLKRLAEVPTSANNWIYQQAENHQERDKILQSFYEGAFDFSAYGIKTPEDYRIFVDLGRFRNALILDSANATGSTLKGGLTAFAKNYGLEYFDPE